MCVRVDAILLVGLVHRLLGCDMAIGAVRRELEDRVAVREAGADRADSAGAGGVVCLVCIGGAAGALGDLGRAVREGGPDLVAGRAGGADVVVVGH